MWKMHETTVICMYAVLAMCNIILWVYYANYVKKYFNEVSINYSLMRLFSLKFPQPFSDGGAENLTRTVYRNWENLKVMGWKWGQFLWPQVILYFYVYKNRTKASFHQIMTDILDVQECSHGRTRNMPFVYYHSNRIRS